MAEQLTAQAERTLTHCPAELLGVECPFGEGVECIDKADASGRLVECWRECTAVDQRSAG